MITVRLLTDYDFDFVMQLTEHEKWGYLACDIKRYMEYEPKGCFIAEVYGKKAGHVFSVGYGKLGWIGLLIVKAEYRRKGIGIMLLKKAINYLLSRGVEAIKLEAVPDIADLYRKLGFVDEYDSLRFMKIHKKPFIYPGRCLEHVKEDELKELAEFDAKYFGANRQRVLKHLFKDYPQYCFVSKKKQKTIGYIMARKTTHGFWIGPWICDPQHLNVAKQLINSCINSLGKKDTELRVGTPSVNLATTSLLRSFGFKEVSKSIRMFRGECNLSGNFLGVYGIGGPEKG
jgi:ribosomal protein S18 acetylase RimI-like enzyme